jgi:hypothetical protein
LLLTNTWEAIWPKKVFDAHEQDGDAIEYEIHGHPLLRMVDDVLRRDDRGRQ